MTDEAVVEFAKISPALMYLRAPVGAFQAHPENPRVGDVDAIAGSLARFGQQKPIVVQQSTSYVVAGNHTFKAAVSLKWSHIAASVVDMTDEEAAAYLIADNAISDLAAYDTVRKARAYQRLYDQGGQMAFAGTGIAEPTQDDIDTWATLAGGNVEIEPEKPFKGDYAAGPDPAVTDVPNPDAPEKPPMREVVLLLEIADAQLLAQRIKNLQRQYPEGGGLTATILRAVSTAHEHFYGSPDPAATGTADAPETPAEAPAAAAVPATADVPLAPQDASESAA